MSLIQKISDFFDSIFRPSGETIKKQFLKKMDNEIKLFDPILSKNGLMQPNFAEAIYILYKNARLLDDLFQITISSNDLKRRHRFEAQLILTGYNEEDQKLVEELSFDYRKQEVIYNTDALHPASSIYNSQHKKLEKVIKNLNTDSFKNMDKEILQLRQLVDFCHSNFLPILQLFDGNFIPGDFSYKPTYYEVPINKLENALEDLYYQTKGLRITTGTANATIALATMVAGGTLSPEKTTVYLSALKKISYTLTKILSIDKLKKLICYVKLDENYEPRFAVYEGSPRNDFATMFQEKYIADEKRIKNEIQDEQIESELASLFHGVELLVVGAYNNEYNAKLTANSSPSFQWILPLRIIKTFFANYITEKVRTLLNDLVIEGFFNNQTYKTTFSQTVYSILGAPERIQEFENSFTNSERNSIAVIDSYITDSHKDNTFHKKLESMIVSVNVEAQKLTQELTTNLYALYNMLDELLQDSKKPTSELIENLKGLMLSSRNKENTAFLEQTFPTWKIFFEIMKNYAIISKADINNG